jgi:iron complex outermembrane receptor protein
VGGGAGFQIRGFLTQTNESFIDGMRMYSRTPVEDKERIEVMNGPAGFLYGIANSAGIINYVLKHPTDTPLLNVTVGNYGGEQGYIHGDLGGPIDSAGKFGYRLNLLYVGKGDTGIHDQTHERYLISGALDWHISPDTLLSMDYSLFDIQINHGDDIFMIGSGVTAIPDAPDAAKNYMPSYSFAEDSYSRYGIKLTSKLSKVFSLRSAFAYSDTNRYRHRAKDTIINNAGDYTMSRNYYNTDRFVSEGYLFLDAVFDTGPVGHKVTLGLSEEYSEIKYAYPYVNQNISFSGVGNIYYPTLWPADESWETTGSPDRTTETTNILTVTLADQVTLSEQWQMTFGGVYTAITDKNWNYSSYRTTGTYTEKPEYDEGALTPSVSLLYKPRPEVTTYVTYIEALQKGATAPSTAANANETLEPYVGTQVEMGAKAVLGGVNLSAAVFRIEQANAYTDSVTNIYSEDGREIHIGGEFVVLGKVTENLTLSGGFTILRAYVDKTATAGLQGKTPTGVPEEMARFYAEYALPWVKGLTLTGGASYTGSEYVNSMNTLSIPDVVTGDVGARYRMKLYGRDLTLRFNVANVSDESYWTTMGSYLSLGAPRTFAFSASMKF